jgi:hypothetical protein
MTPYFELPGFQHLYLEDGYVLGLEESADELVFLVEFVLTEAHPVYQPPRPGEQYCHRKGRIRFYGINAVEWLRRDFKPNTDRDGSIDYGNIDSFLSSGNVHDLEGEWGEVRITARNVEANLDETRT